MPTFENHSMPLLNQTLRPSQRGFSLVDLLLAVVLGGLLSGVVLQALVVDTRAAQRLGRLLRERQQGQRALELIRQELQQAEAISLNGDFAGACGLSGRDPVLQLSTAAGVITYSVGEAPASIWRGAVLMRCGPAYTLGGRFSDGEHQNRVLLDGLVSADGFSVEQNNSTGVLELQLIRAFAGGPELRMQSAAAFDSSSVHRS